MNTPTNIFSLDPNKADESNNTNRLSLVNYQEFMATVFDNAVPGSAPVVVSFAGKPAEVAKSCWLGEPWQGKELKFPAGHNNYFSLATFQPDESGRYRRHKRLLTQMIT